MFEKLIRLHRPIADHRNDVETPQQPMAIYEVQASQHQAAGYPAASQERAVCPLRRDDDEG
jgi:hypothetical protein